MITIYSCPGCHVSRKAKLWFREHNFSYVEKNIFKALLDKKELDYIFNTLSIDRIISKKGLVMFNNQKEYSKEEFIINNPSVISMPIVIYEDNNEVKSYLNLVKCDRKCAFFNTCGRQK